MIQGTKNQSNTVVRYSDAFKIQVVRELEEGVHSSYKGACDAYGIGSPGTVSRWHELYGTQFKKRKFIRVESKTDRNEMESMKARIRELERALSDTTIDLLLEREFLKMSCERAGDGDVERFKKKHAGMVFTGSGKKPSASRK